MVASLLSSIVGGGTAVGAQSPGLSSSGQPNAQPKAAGFGAQHQPPVFRSLSRTLSSTPPPAAVSAAHFTKQIYSNCFEFCILPPCRVIVFWPGRSPALVISVEAWEE